MLRQQKTQFTLAPVFVALVVISVTYALSARHRYNGVFQFVCRQVYTKHYFGKERLEKWYKDCLADKDRVQSSMRAEKVADILRQRFALLETSHLEIYSPQEDKLVWAGKSAGDNGIRSRGIDGRIVISKVIPKSSAEKVGIKAGDVIISVYGEKAFGAYPYNEIDGDIVVSREGQELPFKVKAEELQIDFSPRLKPLAEDVGLLEISSFRKEFFKKENWDSLTDGMQDYPSIIVDLRGNLGGDFNAVMKALSFFNCEKTDFGILERPSAAALPDLTFKEDSSEDEFYEQLTSSKNLHLKRYPGACFSGAVTVLIDNDTASVSEIFATVMKERVQTRVWGETTRGDMLLGVWYPLSGLGTGYTVSVPEALYVGPSGQVIEGKGVAPSRTLFYKLNEALKGQDSWVQAALTPY